MTLDEVRRAGRFAWNDGYDNDQPVADLFIPGTGFVVAEFNRRGPSEDCMAWYVDAEMYVEDDDAESGWHHLPGCDCKYCRE